MTELFCPLLSGSHDGEACLGDLGGTNLADDETLSEIRHHYFVWQNRLLETDHVGFEHYRRKFFINPAPGDAICSIAPGSDALADVNRRVACNTLDFVHPVPKDVFDSYTLIRNNFSGSHIRRIQDFVAGFDFVVPTHFNASVRELWEQDHKEWPFSLLEEAVRSNPYFLHHQILIDFRACKNLFWNMFIMRSNLFDQYMTFLFQSLDHIRQRIDPVRRSLGYFAERIFSFWFYQKLRENSLYRVCRLPVIEYR